MSCINVDSSLFFVIVQFLLGVASLHTKKVIISMEEEFHGLAVDDNLIDRKLIERILKISSCKGKL